MGLLIFHGLILVCISMTTIQNTFVTGAGELLDPNLFEPSKKQKCVYSRESSLTVVVCHNTNYEEVPQNLKSGIGVLDLTGNRLSGITSNNFAKYTSLKYLDLSDNFLNTIEEGAFQPLQELIALDLTKTRSYTLPKSLFTLPNLQRLFLENNKLNDSVFEIKVTAPLVLLKAPKNSLKKIPQWGPFPTLAYLNLSENYISNISVDDIAPFCKLLTLDLTDNPITFDPSNCDCQIFKSWAKEHNMTVRPDFNCENDNCSPVKFSNKTMTLFKDCEEMIRILKEIQKSKTTWILVVSSVSGSLIIISLILFFVHKRNKKRNEKLKKAHQGAVANVQVELLNESMKDET